MKWELWKLAHQRKKKGTAGLPFHSLPALGPQRAVEALLVQGQHRQALCLTHKEKHHVSHDCFTDYTFHDTYSASFA